MDISISDLWAALTNYQPLSVSSSRSELTNRLGVVIASLTFNIENKIPTTSEHAI
ncbi:MAG: hypothetical protein WA364_13405 [Candidatus Nitrosopolaris sp.]